MSQIDNEDDQTSAKFGDHFSHSERELLILLCEKRDQVAASFFPDHSSARERSRLEDALEQLLDMVQFDPLRARRPAQSLGAQ